MSMFEVSADHLKNLRHLGESASNLLHDVKSSASDATSKQSKRRSLLPQFSRKGSDVKEVPAAIKEDESESADGSTISEDTNDSRRAMPPPPKPVKQGIKPPSSTIPGASTAHSRTISKESNGSNGRSTPVNPSAAPAAKRTVPTKMPHLPAARTSSLQGKPSHTRAASSVSAFGAHSRTASTISTHGAPSAPGEKRGSVSGVRPLTSGSMTSMNAPNQTSPPRPMSRSNAKSQLAAPSRPAFSTYQQHYSPAKSVLPKPGIPSNGKASTAQSVAAAGPAEPEEEEIPMTFEIAREQIDLLQLSLLHQSSAATLRAYEYSAKHKLSHRHAKLQQEFQAIETRERTQRKQINLEALESWCGVGLRDSILLAEHLQVLNRAVADLRELTEPGSRFLDMTTTFEDWTMKAESVLLGDGKSGSNSGAFIEALPESWCTAHTSLAIKLRSVQHDLRALPPAPQEADLEDPSSLKLLLETCFRLVDGMLRELDVMMKVQKEVTSRGKAQVDEQVKTILQPHDHEHGNSSLLDKGTWTPAWRKQADGAVAGA